MGSYNSLEVESSSCFHFLFCRMWLLKLPKLQLATESLSLLQRCFVSLHEVAELSRIACPFVRLLMFKSEVGVCQWNKMQQSCSFLYCRRSATWLHETCMKNSLFPCCWTLSAIVLLVRMISFVKCRLYSMLSFVSNFLLLLLASFWFAIAVDITM